MGKITYTEPKKVLITAEKEKINRIKWISFRTEKSMVEIINEGIDLVIQNYKEIDKKYKDVEK